MHKVVLADAAGCNWTYIIMEVESIADFEELAGKVETEAHLIELTRHENWDWVKDIEEAADVAHDLHAPFYVFTTTRGEAGYTKYFMSCAPLN